MVSAFVHTACLAVFTNDFAAPCGTAEGGQLHPFVINGKFVGVGHIRNNGGAFRVHFPFQTQKYETGFGQFGSVPCP
jgi:hypothetical protein